jgi:hypothetical protein
MSALTDDRAVPVPVRELAARLSALFQRDVEIVKQLNNAHDRLAHANAQLYPGRAPDLHHVHWQIHRAFCAYQHAAEQRRQLAIDIGELSQQLTQALCAAGWSADQARHTNVHKLARPNLRPALHVDRGDYAAERPA